MNPALDVEGTIEIGFDEGGGRLVADGRRLVFEVDEGANVHTLLGRHTLRALASHLDRAGLTLQVQRGDRVLVRAGRDAQAGPVSRLLRLPHVRIRRSFALGYLLLALRRGVFPVRLSGSSDA